MSYSISPGSEKNLARVTLLLTLTAGREVTVAGSFNDWDPDATAMTDPDGNGAYVCTFELPYGYYEYKFVVDGEWLLDESNPNFASNDFGTLNSVLNVGALAQ